MVLRELPDSKLGDTWVSFYLNEVVTIRDKDWDKLAPYFSIPEDVKDIDFVKIKLDEQQMPENFETFDKTDKNNKTDRDLFDSGLGGLWKDREDIKDSVEYARQLRKQAQNRQRMRS